MRTAKSTHYPIIRITGTKDGAFAIGTHYVEIGGVDDLVQAVQISWPDGVSNATITLESSNFLVTESAPATGDPTARSTETDGYRWATEPVTITGPTASAAGSFMLHIGNCGARRLRLKIVATAITQLYILGHGKQ